MTVEVDRARPVSDAGRPRYELADLLAQMKHSLGEIKAGLDQVAKASEKQSAKLDRISHIIYAAGVVLTIGVVVGGFVLNKSFDVLVAMLKAR